MKSKKRILVCPLDWGLGHATRCIPVIHELQKQGAEVIIAAYKRPLELLKQEFPQLQLIVFPGYEIAYPENGSMVLKMAFSIPKILRKINEEKKFLKDIVRNEKIDGVISDNRYGLGITDVPTVLMLHQLMIKSPFGERLLHQITLNYVKQFSFCWVPDFAGENNLSGDLAHKYPLPDNARFVGALSRFSAFPQNKTAEKKYDLLAIISGPEPQRTVFEKMIVKQVSQLPQQTLVVSGKPENKVQIEKTGNAEIVSHLNAEQLFNALSASELVLTRPGYSTIMDLAVMRKKAIFVPTPGQTEQEYLGKLYQQKKLHLCVKQNELDVVKAIEQVSAFNGFSEFSETELLSENVEEFLSSC
ncbi:MAG: UDP-N-acetylglucosamine--N-acetylmuramyl-(pentapeptide) pyrophosphoryl-undecaprenol N-acetylglucosamine transferase [Bacteroidia bacterium]|nr:UDP-N-acetylglucosamine--N-acetylmuramyl-(pentapeptide) pyrophosphoryl-undecaprenol N-acetylglucosamine transferase [Bacteroidia bacterium]